MRTAWLLVKVAICSTHPPRNAKPYRPNATTPLVTVLNRVPPAIDTVTSTLLPWNPGANSNHGLLVIEAGVERVAFGGYMTRMGGIDQEGLAVYKAPHLP